MSIQDSPAMEAPIRRTVLCVEDEDPQLRLRKNIFESAGFHFLGARNGVDALEIIKNHEVDAVVLDYWLAGMKGVEIAEKIKKMRANMPIVVLSGFGALPGETIGLVNTWFQKGRVQPEELVNEVKRLIDFRGPSPTER
jgi:DNA-binding NtrC family response regulator